MGKVQGNQATSRKYYVKIVWNDQKRPRVEGGMQEYRNRGRAEVQAMKYLPSPTSKKVEQEEIQVVPDNPKKITRVTADLP